MRFQYRILAIAVLVLLAASYGSCQDGEIHETVLDNGLTVVTKEVHFAPLVAVQIFYNVGSRNEHSGITGLSHFCEHINYRGTTEFGSRDIDRLLAEIGSPDSNGYTWVDNTSFYAKAPSEHVDLVLRAEASRMTNCLYRPEDVESERPVVLSEMEGAYNDPSERLNEETWAAAFKAHPYGHPILGWQTDVQGVTRDEAFEYYHTYYAPNNAVLVIVGDFDTPEIIAKVKDHFGSIPRGEDPQLVRTIEPKQRGERRVVTKAAAASSQIQILYHTPPTSHSDHIALDVLSSVLTTGRTGRLDKQVAEEGLATSVYAWNADLKDPSVFIIGATLPEGGETQECLDAILLAVQELAENLISDEELALHKKQVRAGYVLSQESISDQAMVIGDYVTAAGIDYVNTYLDRVAAVTANDIMRVAKMYLTEDNRTVGILLPSGEEPTGYSEGGPSGKADYRGRESVMGPERVIAPCVALSAESAPKTSAVRKTLPNGLVAIVVENHANPSVAISGLVRAGAIYDPPEKPGLASYTAYCLDTGTATRDWEKLGSEIDALGASLEFEGRAETASLSARALSEDFERILELAGDCLINPVFPDERMELARDDLVTALAAKAGDTYQSASIAAQQMIYPRAHPYYHDPDGTPSGLAAITRDDIVAFHSKFYRPDTTVITVVGDVTPDRAFAEIEKVFGAWRAEGDPPRISLPDIAALPEERSTRIDLADKMQTDFVIVAPGLKRSSPDYYAAEIANMILGGSGISRINDEVREKRGLAYYTYSYLDTGSGQGGVCAGAGTNPANTDEAIGIVREQIAKAATGDFTDDEIRLAKGQWLGWRINALDTNQAIGQSYCTMEYYGLGIDYHRRLPEIIKALTKEQIVDAAKKYFGAEHWAVAVVGPPPGSESEQ